jgi:uncharacterized protein
VLSQVDGLVAFRLTASQDRKALGLWIEGQADRDAGKALLGRLPEKQQGQAVVWLPARGILDDVTFPPKLTYDSSRAPKRGEAHRRVDLSPLNVAALKERLAHVEAEVKANDPKALRTEITRLKAELTKAGKNNQHPQSTPIDRKAVEAAEIRGWNAGVEATRQALIAKGRAVSDAVTAILATAVPFKQSMRRAAPGPPPPHKLIDKQSTPPAVRMNGRGAGEPLPRGERACLIAIAQHHNGVRREQLTVLTGYADRRAADLEGLRDLRGRVAIQEFFRRRAGSRCANVQMKWRERRDSNSRSRFWRPVLLPLSYTPLLELAPTAGIEPAYPRPQRSALPLS